MVMRLIISLRWNQPPSHGILQKELITGSRNSATQNAQLLFKIPISNFGEIWNNTALFEFGKVWCKTAALTKNEVQRRFPKYLWFYPPPYLKMGK